MYFYTFQKVLGFGVQNLNDLHKWLWIKSDGCCDHLKALRRISGQKLIKFEPDSVCPSFPNTLNTSEPILIIFTCHVHRINQKFLLMLFKYNNDMNVFYSCSSFHCNIELQVQFISVTKYPAKRTNLHSYILLVVYFDHWKGDFLAVFMLNKTPIYIDAGAFYIFHLFL